MPKFRKKPIVVEAEQFIAEALMWPQGVYRVTDVHPDAVACIRVRGGLYCVWNERGRCWQEVEPGDWIIHGISGCRYPCKAEIFAQIYEKVEEAPRRIDAGGPGNICGGCGSPDPHQMHNH